MLVLNSISLMVQLGLGLTAHDINVIVTINEGQ